MYNCSADILIHLSHSNPHPFYGVASEERAAWSCAGEYSGLSPEAALTELPLEFGQAAEGGGDEVSILVLDVFQDVFPVQADGIGDEEWTVQVRQ